MLITAAGKIGAGKSTITKLLSDVLETKAVYEPIEENPLLEKFYEDRGKYGFVFQIDMISRRFELIQQALMKDNSVLDRSILEDSIFLDQLHYEGYVNDFEWEAYHKLLDRMMKELACLPKKLPDLLVYIDVDFETEIEHINKRAREFEKVNKGDELYEYFKLHSQFYDEWIENFDLTPVIRIDAKQYDFANNKEDQQEVLAQIVAKLVEIRALTFNEAVLAYCNIYEAQPKDVAIKLYNKVQTLMNGMLEYHNLALLYDEKLDTVEKLKKRIKNQNKK
ncbi:deoxyadenosine kinase / deoxyguanosine kinase [Enterococcus phage nattely]|uniref:Deoxyadenosine/Deoxyguanosine kinase n=2 Tax=Vipetofemvirus TaxID=2948949 RepID=A0ACA9ASF8_9CAUD|nr:deoxyadenosine kinase / deoxyguanosine kinase [Enterococcus phage nattely]QIQ66186.1 deoxyadenosine kinase / deoxyguanosine kinase [Enterococcus phage nattely]CAD0281798.1 Deoxyadenosine/Deoxyguanosine kinase [Enterococcus phage vB_EfaS_140]